MPVLAQRAVDTGIERIDAVGDLVPLLFSDATYKSYPDSYVSRRNWRALGAWIDTLSVRSGAVDLDFDGVETIDDWIVRLRAAGHYVYASSGTSGRASLFQVSDVDRARDQEFFRLWWRWAAGITPAQDREVFALFPPSGNHRMVESFGLQAKAFAKGGSPNFISTKPLHFEDVNALSRLRRQIQQGSATPSQVKAFEDGAAQQQEYMRESIGRLADRLVEHRAEPAIFMGFWVVLYHVIQAAKERGWPGGLHPDSAILVGGGLKGAQLPDGFEHGIRKDFGLPASRYMQVYGMSELTTAWPRCTEGGYHAPAWVIPLVLDDSGEQLVRPADGRVEGRLAIIDLSLDARWGGMISGDRVTLNLGRCRCGRGSPAVDGEIVRYSDLPDSEDKVTCAGTMDDYVRGELAAAGV